MKTHLNKGFCIALFLVKTIAAQHIFIGTDLLVTGTGSLYVSGDFTTNSVANFTNDATVEIKGNISNDKVGMTQGSGNIILSGTTSQIISGAQPFVVNNITLNCNFSGTDDIVLNKNLIIGTSATFINGVIEPNNASVTFNSGATYSGESDASHVNGLVEKIGNQAFTFPVGDATKLRTAAITAPSLETDAFTCIYKRANPDVDFIGTSLDTGLDHISNCEYWLIDQTVGSSTVYVALSYDNDYSCGITDTSALFVSNLETLVWKNRGHGARTGTETHGTIQATELNEDWGAFTLASSSGENPLPIELLNFIANYNTSQKGVDLKWETASEINSDYFSVERSENGNVWIEIAKVKAAGNTSSVTNYKIFDPEPFIGINYYRLKETDFNGAWFYSSIESVTSSAESTVLSIFPNPITSTATLNYWVDRDEEFLMEISDVIGRVLLKKNVFFKKGENKIPLEMGSFIPGNYFLKIYSPLFSDVETKKLIKLN